VRLLVCGGAGFIGSHFARLAAGNLVERLVVLDALTYAGRRETIADLIAGGAEFVHARIQDAGAVRRTLGDHAISHVVNFAAETHNDRSLLESGDFIQTNTFGVHVLLEAVRAHGAERLVQVSTDEVYGSIATGEFTEESPLRPNTPYSASKAGGDLLCRASHTAYGTPVIVTRGGNTYGPFQYPEKLVPFFVTRLLDGKKAPLYGKGAEVREWIHVGDHAAGVWTALTRGEPGEVYNISGANERPNLWTARAILRELGLGEERLKRIPDPRGAAHDRRYAMDSSRLRALGWVPQVPLDQGLRETIRWYRENQAWWRPVVADPEHLAFVARFYGAALGEDL
jgi:dTDP-glucose 4,6-dehydratase